MTENIETHEVTIENVDDEIEIQEMNSQPDPTPSKCNKIVLRKGEKIKIILDQEWNEATVISRSGKATGRYCNSYNLRLANGTIKEMDLSNKQFEKVDDINVTDQVWMHEEIFANLLPKEKRDSEACMTAKIDELKKLQEFNTYEIVDDVGQDYITTT